MASSKSVVLAALIANGAIAVMKFAGWLLTGSPSMLSETYHSVSDTGNQVLLLVGLRYGGREPSRGHPFGYGKAQFFYAFLVAVLLFGIAGWESLKHGYGALLHGVHRPSGDITLLEFSFPAIWVNYTVLGGAIVFETYALKKAYANMRGQIEEYGWSGLREAFRKTSDVTVLTALTEDAIALAGAALAMTGIALTQVTGNPVFDAATALLIGLLLMGFALALAWENKRLIIGESLPDDAEQDLVDLVSGYPGVAHVDGFRSVFFGPGRVLVTADVSFDSDLDVADVDTAITEIEDDLVTADPRVRKVYIEPER
jgi:cation diffusion facilitator family transporter